MFPVGSLGVQGYPWEVVLFQGGVSLLGVPLRGGVVAPARGAFPCGGACVAGSRGGCCVCLWVGEARSAPNPRSSSGGGPLPAGAPWSPQETRGTHPPHPEQGTTSPGNAPYGAASDRSNGANPHTPLMNTRDPTGHPGTPRDTQGHHGTPRDTRNPKDPHTNHLARDPPSGNAHHLGKAVAPT